MIEINAGCHYDCKMPSVDVYKTISTNFGRHVIQNCSLISDASHVWVNAVKCLAQHSVICFIVRADDRMGL